MTATENDPLMVYTEDDWDDFVTDMLSYIEKGYLDKHIKELAKACVTRGKMPNKKKPKPMAKVPAGIFSPKRNSDHVIEGNKIVGNTIEALPPKRRVRSGIKPPPPTWVAIEGKHYSRSDLLGKKFSWHHGGKGNIIAEIKGIGIRSAKLILTTERGEPLTVDDPRCALLSANHLKQLKEKEFVFLVNDSIGPFMDQLKIKPIKVEV